MLRQLTRVVAGTGTSVPAGIRQWVRRHGPLTFIASGVVQFLVANVYFTHYNGLGAYFGVTGVLHVVFYGVLSGIIVLCGVQLARKDISPDHYPRAVAWLVVGLGFLLLLNGPIMLIIGAGMPTVYLFGWLLNVVATGSVGGAVVGMAEARSIQNAKKNQHLRTQQQAVEAEAHRLDYLNGLLRHEVLNNVNVIKGYAELALETDPGHLRDELETIRDQSEEMSNIITDVRVLLESLKGASSLSERNVSTIIEEELSNVQAKTDRVVEIEQDVPDDIEVMADDLLPRVFANLFSNAVQHNESGTPRISVTVDDAGDTVSIRVADNGSGIPAWKRANLFDRQERADHGMGLYLVSELIDRYGGSIDLVETGPDGTEFVVRFDRVPDEASPVAQNQATAISLSP